MAPSRALCACSWPIAAAHLPPVALTFEYPAESVIINKIFGLVL